MPSEINYDAVLSAFDALVSRGVIYYAPRKTIQFDDDGFPFEFHISTSLQKKPGNGDPVSGHDDPNAKKPECFGPGSDIGNDDPGTLLATIHGTHLLVVNKFCMFRPQLLLLTADSYRRQREPLDLDDLSAACTVLDSYHAHASLFVIYNCGPRGGASRQHKHLQVLPRPERLFPDDTSGRSAVPYRYFLRYLHDIELGSKEGQRRLLEIYNELLSEAKNALADEIEGEDYIPHNVALVKEWIIVIPRRSADFEGAATNTPGMLGSLWLTSDEQMEQWKRVGPKRALAGLGVPDTKI